MSAFMVATFQPHKANDDADVAVERGAQTKLKEYMHEKCSLKAIGDVDGITKSSTIESGRRRYDLHVETAGGRFRRALQG